MRRKTLKAQVDELERTLRIEQAGIESGRLQYNALQDAYQKAQMEIINLKNEINHLHFIIDKIAEATGEA